MIRVRQQGKDHAVLGYVLQTLRELFGIVVAVRADGEDLRRVALLLVPKVFQLAELGDAIGSPMAAIEDEEDILFAAKVG